MIYVCSLVDLGRYAASLEPGRVISIVAPEEQPSTPAGLESSAHLRVSCHDITAPFSTDIVPDRQHVEQIVAFAREWNPRTPMLIHCQAGISRSTATALITYAAHFPGTLEDAAAHLRRTGPHVRPNKLLIKIGDELLGLDGRLVAAVAGMGEASIAIPRGLVNIPHPGAAGHVGAVID